MASPKSIRCAKTIGAVITERNIFAPLCIFIMTSPINKAVASGNGNTVDCLQRNDTFKLQIAKEVYKSVECSHQYYKWYGLVIFPIYLVGMRRLYIS
jgi:hypothetical protein